MKPTFKWLLILLALLIIFFLLIPVGIYNSALYLIVIVGAIAITFTGLKLISAATAGKRPTPEQYQAMSESEQAEYQSKTKNQGCTIIIIILAIFFGSAFLMILRETLMESSELNDYGSVTMAKIVDGNSISSRKFDFSNLVLAFKQKNGDSAFYKHSISAKEFKGYFKNEQIPIVYSTRNPRILRILYTPEELDEYTRKEKAHEN